MRREGLSERLMAGWVPPTIAYILILGAGGVTAKVALRHITWEQMVLWLPIAYIVFCILLIAFRGASFPVGVGGAWAAVTAFAASSALILFFYALTKGPASRVTPATSAYPIVTVIGSALFLAERLTVARGIGTALVILGVVLLSR